MTSPDPIAASAEPDQPASAPWPSNGPTVYRPSGLEPAPKPRRWLVILGAFWGLILVASAVYAIGTGRPTERDQTTVVQALPIADKAVADLVAATTSDGQAVAAISDLTVTQCSVTPFRSGARAQRTVTAMTAAGTEEALMNRIADRLGVPYQAGVRGGGSPRLTADAGFFVAVNGTVPSPGVLRFVVDTGDCRPPGDIPPSATAAGTPTAAQRASLEGVFRRLGVTGRTWSLHTATCPGGGQLTTVEADAPAPRGPLDTPLMSLGERVAIATPDLFAYTPVGGPDIAVRRIGENIVATVTTRCR